MIARRQAIGIVISVGGGMLAAAIWPRAAGAEEDVLAPIYPLLIDLPGWFAGRPGGMATKKLGVSMTVVARAYRRGDAVVMAEVAITDAVWTWRGLLGMKAGRDDPIGEPEVMKIPFYDTFGMVRVTFATNAQFILTFKGIPSAEAAALAQQFDFKAIQGALPK
jgi:hypothetical protein